MGWGESLDPPDSPVCRLCICGGTPQRTGLHSGLVCFYFLQLLFFGLQWKMCTTPAAVESWQLAASREPWKLEVRPPAQWLEAAAVDSSGSSSSLQGPAVGSGVSSVPTRSETHAPTPDGPDLRVTRHISVAVPGLPTVSWCSNSDHFSLRPQSKILFTVM